MVLQIKSNRFIRNLLGQICAPVLVVFAVLAGAEMPLLAGDPTDLPGLTWHSPIVRSRGIRDPEIKPTAASVDAPQDSSRIQRLEEQVEALRIRLSFAEELTPTPEYALDDEIMLEAECTECGTGYQLTPDGQVFESQYPTLKWSGFMQLDSGWVIQDDANTQSVGDIDSKTGLRRVRLRAAGKIRRDSSYVVDLDFAASGHPSFRDVVLRLHEIPKLQNLQFGYFQQPFGMDALTSGRELLFQERLLPFAFAPFRQTGIGSYGTFAEKRGTYSMSTYWFPTNEFGVYNSGSGGHAIAGRVTTLPLDRGDAHLIHIGFDYSMGDPGDNQVRYAIEPGFFVTDPADNSTNRTVGAIVDTGNIPTNIYNLFNAELAAAYGPFHLQSEARFSVVSQIGGPRLSFPGYYISAGYSLTGESRPYNRDHGVFDKIIPYRDWELGQGGGAYELVAGWSYIDLNDHNIQGGRASELSAGINWYLNKHVKFSLNLISVNLDDPDFGRSHAWVGASRVQAEF